MHSSIFFELTSVLVLATVFGAIALALRLPTIIGYIAAGVVVGSVGILHLDSLETLNGLAQIGIASLLFMVGMEMRMDQIREYGKAALFTGLGQMVFTSVVGYAILRMLGFEPLTSLYIAVALTLSSTIIVIKLLSEKQALESHYGRLVVGFLLVQDFMALGFLILLSSMSAGSAGGSVPLAATLMAFGKGSLLLGGSLLFGKYVLNRIMNWAAHSGELVFLLSLGWGMGLAALAGSQTMGLTIEIGAFMAGLAMADSIERHHVASRIRPLRDFFIMMFFVVLGSQMAIGDLASVAVPTILLSLYVLIGNPLLMLVIMGALGYRSRVSFLVSVTVAQISEFSLIMMALGLKLGHVNQQAVTLVTAVGVVTIALSSYLILNADRIYPHIRQFLRLFEFGRARKDGGSAHDAKTGHVVLIGCHRIGHNILQALERGRKDFVVVDMAPEIVDDLTRRGIGAIYGDITDPDIQDALNVAKARLIVSTIPDTHAALHLLRMLKRMRARAKVVLTAQNEHDAALYYREGADYVILPQFMSGRHMAHVIEKDKTLRSLASMRKRDLAVIDGTF